MPVNAPLLLSADQLAAAAGRPAGAVRGYIPPLNASIERYNITHGAHDIARLRLAHFLTQILSASRCLHYAEEPTSGECYEGRLDLGNVEEGDGPRYRGRGLLPLVGREAYVMYGRAAGRRFDLWPELVAEMDYAADVAGWLWSRHRAGEAAREDDLAGVTERLFGCVAVRSMDLSERHDLLAHCKGVLAKGVLGSTVLGMPMEPAVSCAA